MTNEFILIKGKNAVVHSDKCKCTKKIGVQQCAYGYTKEEVVADCATSMKIQFAPCAEQKLNLLNQN